MIHHYQSCRPQVCPAGSIMENIGWIPHEKSLKCSRSIISPIKNAFITKKNPETKVFQQHSTTTGWWFEPLWKIWKSIGMISNPIYGKIKLMATKPPTRQQLPAPRPRDFSFSSFSRKANSSASISACNFSSISLMRASTWVAWLSFTKVSPRFHQGMSGGHRKMRPLDVYWG